MEIIDLRSDTVTHPTPAMREAMAKAPVGDDVMGEDPTINQLQEMAAHILGKEAGLFVASGTMGNLVAILSHCGRGDEVIMGNQGHTFLHEAANISALGGIHSCQLLNQPDGTLALDDIEAAIREQPDPHHPFTRLITIENTQNSCGGIPLTVAYTQAVGELAHRHSLLLHLDGARLFNAAIALKKSAGELAAPVDSVTICLSKGLSAPVGSVLCGDSDFIGRAIRIRKQVGGGMRQAGILAAAGIIALEQMVDRLAEDHVLAKKLAEGLAGLPGISLDPLVPPTNMVFFYLDKEISLTTSEFVDKLREKGLLCFSSGARRIRMVTHYGIESKHIDLAIQICKNVMHELH